MSDGPAARASDAALSDPSRPAPDAALLNFGSAWAFYFATVFLHLGESSAEDSPGPMAYALARYAGGAALFGVLYAFQRRKFTSREVVKFVLLRGLFNTAAVVCFYQAVAAGSPGLANVLNMTYPVFVALLSGPLLRETPDRRTAALTLLSLCGIGMKLFSVGEVGIESSLWALASAALAGISVTTLRGAARETGPAEILFWQFLIGTIALAPFAGAPLFALFTRTMTDAANSDAWVFVACSSGLGVLGQLVLALSYRRMSASLGSIISTSRIPIAVLWGWLFLGESGDAFSWAGAALILLCNVLLAFQGSGGKNGAGPTRSSGGA